ncbi:MAG: hypothetical protein M3268_02185 [Acidobacteriota bacterium]|nr:hypothetical protein [Acidobacteriota bacterium]
MKLAGALAALVTLSSIPPAAAARARQTPPPRVEKAYMKNVNRTRVDSALLYVANTPEQFVGLQLRAWYATQTLSKPADQIVLELFSFAHAALYRRDDERRLVAEADGSQIDLGPLSRGELAGEIRADGRETFSADKASALAMQVPLPQAARLRGGADKSLVLEIMSADLRPSQIYRLARARSVELRVGATRLPLTETQLSILREFAAEVIPAGVVPADEPPAPSAAAKFPDVPSDENNAALEATTKWLASALSKYGDAVGLGGRDATRVEAVVFKGCEMKYRTVGRPLTSSPYAPAPSETRFNLADLSAARVNAVVMGSGSTLLFGTRDAEQKISVIYTTNKGDDKRALDTASVQLNKADAAERVGVALRHAINLCQARH